MGDTFIKLEAHWDQDSSIFFTRISGLVGYTELKQWEELLINESQKIPANSEFKFFVDESGYQFNDQNVHKAKKDIMPKFLAHYGFMLSVLPTVEITRLRKEIKLNDKGIHCIAICMNHHDEEKMAEIQQTYGKENEKYFSNFQRAEQWVQAYRHKLP